MIYNIEVGEWDSMNNPLHVFCTLKGPEMDLRAKWKEWQENLDNAIGQCPHLEHEKLLKEWEANRTRILNELKKTWDIPEEEKDFLATRFFIKFLCKMHGFEIIEDAVSVFTEEY